MMSAMASECPEVSFLRPHLLRGRGLTEAAVDLLVKQWEARPELSFIRFLVDAQVIDVKLASIVEVVRKGGVTMDLTALFARTGRPATVPAKSVSPAPSLQRPAAAPASAVRGVAPPQPGPRIPSAEPGPLDAPIRLGRYTLLEKLGEGPAAQIFRAFHQMLGISVVVKLFRARIADITVEQHWLAAAKLLARIDHPNIVRVLDSGTCEERSYIVFEHLRAPSLHAIVREHGRQSAALVARIGLQIGDALHVAHEHQLSHGAVSPESILLRRDGQLTLTDFGPVSLRVAVDQTTEPAPLDPRSDLYGLAASLYFAATGRQPFEPSVPSRAALLTQRTAEPIEVLYPEFDGALAQAIMGLLATESTQRYRVWEDVGQVFRAALQRHAGSNGVKSGKDA